MFRVIAFVLLPVFFLSGVAHAGKNLPEGHSEKLELLRERISDLKKELVSMHGQRDDLQDALEKAEKDIGAVAAALRRLDGQADQSRKDVHKLQRTYDAEQLKLDKMRVTLEKELQLAYMAGKQEQVKLLLNQEDPAALGRLMVYHKYFMRARTQAMQDIRVTLIRLADIERELLVQRSGIQVLIEQQQEKSSRLLARQAQRREILVQLQDRLTGKTARLAALETDERQLQQLVQSLQQAIKDISLPAGEYESLRSLKGKLHWPVAGHISMHYGERHISGKLRSRGVHITSRSGADVHAIARGRVIFADWLRGFGLLMIIDHGDNYMSLSASTGKWVSGWRATRWLPRRVIAAGRRRQGFILSCARMVALLILIAGLAGNPARTCKPVVAELLRFPGVGYRVPSCIVISQ
jgi:septal ring factor EnvC (AmiA/AmiB activator)